MPDSGNATPPPRGASTTSPADAAMDHAIQLWVAENVRPFAEYLAARDAGGAGTSANPFLHHAERSFQRVVGTL